MTRFASIVCQAALNVSVNMEDDGEAYVANRLMQVPGCKLTVVDVGAYRGDWCSKFAEGSTGNAIVAVEPSKEMCDFMKEMFRNCSGEVEIICAAAWKKSGEYLTIFLCPRASDLTTASAGAAKAWEKVFDAEYESRMARTITIDEIVLNRMHEKEKNGIWILKIDCEGGELTVLEGAEKSLEETRFDVVQFEYNLASIESGHMLRSYFELFSRHGYRVGRLFPRGVGFLDYHPKLNALTNGNWVAVAGGRSDLIELLSLEGFDGGYFLGLLP